MLRPYVYYSYSGSHRSNDVVKATPRSVFKIPDGVPQNDTTDRAMYWRNNGDVGLSSLTIWCHFMNAKHPEADKVEWKDIPYDVDDFSRCYRLLEAVPEWKEKMQVSSLSEASNTWKVLVQRWPELTQLYEQKEYAQLKESLNQIRLNQ